ncbi:MAG TPA: CoA activase [Dehalococcoidia bacterium]|nr:CoA activase [Dehalococcoidia bacterium]
MLVAGIDVGGKNVHIVLMKDGTMLEKGAAPTGIKKAEAVEQLYDKVLRQAGLKREDVEHVVATGSSGRRVTFAQGVIPEAAADARAVVRLIPSARTIIDVGAEEGRAIKINSEGRVLDFAINEKCAAGTGTFVDTMARALEITVEEMAKASLQSTQSIPMNAQCAVFGESEVVSLIHAKTPKHDIARAVHDAIAGRIGSVARIVGLEKDVVMIGGVAKNTGFVESLKRELATDVLIPDEPDFVGALGAAVAAETGVIEEKVETRVVERQDYEESSN